MLYLSIIIVYLFLPMSDKRFKKIVQKFKERFDMTYQGFEAFIKTRVDIDGRNLKTILKKVQENMEQKQSTSYTDEDLKLFLHLVAAIQTEGSLAKVSNSLESYTKIKFLQQQKKSEKVDSFISYNEPEKQKQRSEVKKQKSKPNYIEIQDDEDEQQKIIKNKQRKPKKETKQVLTKEEKQRKQLQTIQQQKTDEISVNNTDKISLESEQQKNKSNKIPEIVEGHPNETEGVSIQRYEKTGQDFMNPVIKFLINYNNCSTWRRYSEFEKLMAYLKRKYQGLVLPQIPPKEGIKGGINYLWGASVDQIFLTQRRQKLEILLNRLLKCQYICHDEFLKKFIEDDNFQLPQIGESNSYLKTLTGYTDIVFNYSQLKDYGMAYYNYLSEFKKKQIETLVAKKYEETQKIIECILASNHHRRTINQNFNKRRQILYNYSQHVNPISKSELDIILEKSEIQCQELSKQFNKYVQLKSHEGWLGELLKQKKINANGNSSGSIQQDYDKTIERINRIEQNLMKSIELFEQDKKRVLSNLGQNFIKWRINVHP